MSFVNIRPTICDKAVDVFLPTLKLFFDWFVTSKMIEIFHGNSFSTVDIIFINEDFNNATIFINETSMLSVDLNNIKLDDVNFDDGDPETIVKPCQTFGLV